MTPVMTEQEAQQCSEYLLHGQARSLNHPRLRFNRGFHDGTGEASRGHHRDMTTHFDKIYASAYKKGQMIFSKEGIRPKTSDSAWDEFVQDELCYA